MTEQAHSPLPNGGRKKLGGRPAKSESEKLKHVPLRLTSAERQQAEANANEAGLSLSAYLRERTLGKTVKSVVPALNREAYAELARLSANLNQIAAHYNAAGVSSENTSLIKLIQNLSNEVKSLRLSLLGIEGDQQ